VAPRRSPRFNGRVVNGRMVGGRARLVGPVGAALVALGGAAVAACGAPKASQSGATSVTATAPRPGVVGPVYAPPKPCRSVAAPGTYSRAELMTTQDQVEQATVGQILSLGIGVSTVEVGLLPGREPLAGRLAHTFGPKLSITVGLTSYCGGPGRSPVCSSMPVGDPLPPGLGLALALHDRTITTGNFGDATLVVSESGKGTFQMDTGQPLIAQVVRRGTRRVVGTYGAGIGGTGYGPEVVAGRDESIPVVFGTARCDGGPGSAMPRGDYDVVVYVHPEGRGGGPVYYARAVPLVVK